MSIFRNGKLIYLRSNEPNEFWASLIEKAYAKFYGSYAALVAGGPLVAAVDFTGGIPQKITIEENQSDEKNTSLLQTLQIASANEAFISTSLMSSGTHLAEAESYGLTNNHMYSVTKVVDVSRFYQTESKHLVR